MPMKRHILRLLAASLLLGACSDPLVDSAASGDEGGLALRVATSRNETDAAYDPMEHLVVRLYNAEGGLLRKYTAADDIPARLALRAGDYRIAVEAGERAAADFVKRFYTGEETFTVTAGETTPEVTCRIRNTTVEVRFDASVAEQLAEGYRATVMTGEAFDAEAAASGAVPALDYTTDATGYFTLPEGVTAMAYRFEGSHPERGEISREGRLSDLKEGGKYTLTFRFSKDKPGYLEVLLIEVDPSTDDRDDTIIFSPDPSIEGVDFDMAETQRYTAGERSFRIATMGAMQRVTLTADGTEHTLYDAANADLALPEGIAAVAGSRQALTVTLSDPFFATLGAGDRTLAFDIADADGGHLAAAATFRLQGLLPVAETDYDLWTNTVKLKALVFDPEAAVTFAFRKEDGAWIELPGTYAGDDIFEAETTASWSEGTNDAGLAVYRPDPATGVFAAGRYAYRATIDGAETAEATFTTAAGAPIPGGDMENGAMSCFNNDHGSFWDSGNNSLSDPLCVQSTFAGMAGSYCAKLAANKPMALVNLAAGNLFTGSFVVKGVGGTVSFGQPYAWTARPTALRLLYYAASLGAVNQNQHAGPLEVGTQDRMRIYVAIVDWDAPHDVKSGSSKPEGVWDPTDRTSVGEGAIVGYGSTFIDTQSEGDAMIPLELPIHYYDKELKPSKAYTLVISCATSAYGDFMNGCTTNVLYVDDFAWVY
jgi:hypothetical protein